MSLFEILLCGNLTATALILWYLKSLRDDLDDLEDFSVTVLLMISKKLELEIEKHFDVSD